MNRWTRISVLLLALNVGAAAQAAEDPPARLEPQVDVLRDDGGQLTLDDVTGAAQSSRFSPMDIKNLNFGFTRAAYWYRFTVTDARDASGYLLEIAWPPMDFIDVYVPQPDGDVRHVASGDQRPPGASGVMHHHYVIPLPQGVRTIYLRAQIDGAHQLPLKLWAREAFFVHSAGQNTYYGLFYGVMLVMLAYNLLIYSVLRDPSYRDYLLFLSGVGLLLLDLDGLLTPVLWQVSPKLINGSVPLIISMTGFFMARFIQASLQTQLRTPRLHRLLSGTQALALSAGALVFPLPVMQSTFLAVLVAGLTVLVAATIIGIQAIAGQRTARFYVAIWGAFVIGVLVRAFQANGLLPVNAWTTYSIHIGVGLLVTLLSLVLADQFARERRERARLLREKAEARATAQSEFLTKMSHELRTPMNAIVGFTDLALRDRSEPRRLQHLRLIDDASRSLLGIINNVLDLARIESGKLSLERVDFHLPTLLDKVLGLLQPAARKSVALKQSVAPEVPAMLLGDSLRLEQVLINLVGNALKFTENGEVELAVSAEPADTAQVRIRFCVRDTGIGIPSDRLGQLFKPFTQADQSTTRKYGGSGLGLAICRQLVELMGGSIEARSEPGHGSEFSFVLALSASSKSVPATVQDVPREQIAETQIAQRTQGARVLLVEDNAMNRRLACEILNDAGVIVDVAEDGLVAVASVQAKPYDLVLMDVQMPRMDGFEATRRIRALPGFDSLPIIAMTANALAQDREAATAAGMNDFLPKPVDATQVLEMVTRWLVRRDDAPAIGEQLERLASLISEHDFGAQAQFASIATTLQVRHADQARELSAALEAFDYAAAAIAIEKLRAATTGPQKP